MIYVFPIDTGTLMTFDMNLALESVEVVKGTTDNAVKVLPDKQWRGGQVQQASRPIRGRCSKPAGLNMAGAASRQTYTWQALHKTHLPVSAYRPCPCTCPAFLHSSLMTSHSPTALFHTQFLPVSFLTLNFLSPSPLSVILPASPQSAGCAPLAVTSVPLEDLCQAPLDLHPSPWRVSRVASVCCGGQQQQQHSSLHPCDHSPQY
ncbi:uncharacterized protein LOC135091518 isoform X1 [Scylla paramamosain]|uniref:uncharacterized protein LOC135091518 isoform X1 n=1 Tax=Scylla paramamosain TaxID=85552 RepID=UPI0030835B47